VTVEPSPISRRATATRREPIAPRITWQETNDSAVETYSEGQSAHCVAFASLKHSYEKEGDEWVKKDHKGPSDPQAARSTTSRKPSTDPDRAPTAGGKVAHGEKDAREKSKQARKETADARKRS
jgi:cation transport regulator ChaB